MSINKPPVSDEQREYVRRAVRAHLKSMHTVMYLDWDITDPDRLEVAVEHLTHLWLNIRDGIYDIMDTEMDEGITA